MIDVGCLQRLCTWSLVWRKKARVVNHDEYGMANHLDTAAAASLVEETGTYSTVGDAKQCGPTVDSGGDIGSPLRAAA